MLWKQKALILFGVLAILAVVLVVLIACLNLNGYPSSSEQILSSVPVVIGKSDWAFVIRNNGNANKVDQLPSDPWDFQGLTSSSVDAQFYSVGADSCKSSQYKDAVAQTLDQIDMMQRVFQKYDKYFMPAVSSRDIPKAREIRKIGGFLAVNGGYALDSRMSVLREYYLSTSSSDSDGSIDQNLRNPFGKAVVHEMNRLGMIIDLTGSSKTIQLEAIQNSTAPVIFSSSASNALTTHHLNVDDDVLEALGAKGGLVMVPFDKSQCCMSSSSCTVDNVFDHIYYISEIVGRQNVGLGGNVGLGETLYPQGLSTSEGYITLFNKFLSNNTWSVEELQNLAGNNFIRVMKAVEEVSWSMKEAGTAPAEISININEIPSNETGCYSSPIKEHFQPKHLAEVNFYQKLYSFADESTANPSGNDAPSAANPSGNDAPSEANPAENDAHSTTSTTGNALSHTTPGSTTTHPHSTKGSSHIQIGIQCALVPLMMTIFTHPFQLMHRLLQVT